jgi:hypothetical protein
MAHNKKFLRMVSELGCCLCAKNGYHNNIPAEIHYIRSGGVIPLCFEHLHGITGVHSLGSKGFTEMHGILEEELLQRLEFKK